MVQCAITDSPFYDVVYTYCTKGYSRRAYLERHGTEAIVHVALVLALVSLEKLPIDFNNFQLKCPLQIEISLALTKMTFQAWMCLKCETNKELTQTNTFSGNT